MIEELGIAAPADVGYYSGMVDSMFSIAQLFTVRLRLSIIVNRQNYLSDSPSSFIQPMTLCSTNAPINIHTPGSLIPAPLRNTT